MRSDAPTRFALQALVPLEITLQAKDTDGTPLRIGGTHFSATSRDGKAPLHLPVRDLSNGVYLVTLKALHAGRHTVHIM